MSSYVAPRPAFISETLLMSSIYFVAACFVVVMWYVYSPIQMTPLSDYSCHMIILCIVILNLLNWFHMLYEPD